MDLQRVVEELIDYILRIEGWPTFTNDPDDRGGPTKGGITAKTLGRWRGLRRPATAAEVEALSEPEARAIYRHEYIAPWLWVDLVDGVLLRLLVDMAVLHGVPNTAKLLQRAVGAFPDGAVGPKTMAAIRRTSPRTVFSSLLAHRLEFMAADVKANPRQVKYLKGWLRRCASFISLVPSVSVAWPLSS